MIEYYRPLLAYVLSRVPCLADAEDIVQETYLTALLRRDTLEDESKLRPWRHRDE